MTWIHGYSPRGATFRAFIAVTPSLVFAQQKLKYSAAFTAGIFIALSQPPRLSERLESATPLPGKTGTPTIEPGSVAS